MKQKRQILICISGIVMAILIWIAVIGLIRNLGPLISLLGPLFDLKSAYVEQFSSIFAQLSAASIDLPIPLIILFGFCFFLLLRYIRNPRNPAARWTLICLVTILLFLVAVITVLLLTEVNGIRFANVLISLLQVLSAGTL